MDSPPPPLALSSTQRNASHDDGHPSNDAFSIFFFCLLECIHYETQAWEVFPVSELVIRKEKP